MCQTSYYEEGEAGSGTLPWLTEVLSPRSQRKTLYLSDNGIETEKKEGFYPVAHPLLDTVSPT